MSRVALCVLFAFSALPLAAHAVEQSPVGSWSGNLHRGEAAYRVSFQVQSTVDGRLTGTVTGLPERDYTPVHAAVQKSGETLVIDAGGGRYSGTWDQAEGAWVGSWKQVDMSEPLALRLNTYDGVSTRAARSVETVRQPPPAP
ncbi:MAG TPA: hypothetical protein VGM25_03990 [Caulobacteraceae bacterium]|jgi:hypothetical protein